jgi:hypothetical protein
MSSGSFLTCKKDKLTGVKIQDLTNGNRGKGNEGFEKRREFHPIPD